MPIYCTYERKWCGPGPSQAILSLLLGLKQNWKITPLALTVHLNHFNTIIIMRLSNIIFKSLSEKKKKGISFPLLNHFKLRESKWMEKKVISYETGKESDKEPPLHPPTPTHPTHRHLFHQPLHCHTPPSVCSIFVPCQLHHVTSHKRQRKKIINTYIFIHLY